jgi:hypothetical protein
MKYFGQPNLTIVDYKKVKKVFVFDENGEYETDDLKIIEFMKKKKNFIKCEETTTTPPKGEEIKLKHCKKCDFACENQGELLAHYRGFHPKE